MLDHLRTARRTGETMAEYQRMPKEEQAQRKDVGGFVGGALSSGRRVKNAVTERWLITLDADEGGQVTDIDTLVSLYDCACAMYTTHSHTPTHPRLRWIIPLSRGVSVEEYGAIARRVAELIGIESMDVTTYQPERLMYWPSCPDDAHPLFKAWDGVMLDPDEVLRSYGEGEAWKDVSLWPISSREHEVEVRELRLAGDPEAKPGIVGAFCRVYNVPMAIDKFLPDIYTACEFASGKPRYTYTAGSSSGGAVVEDNGKFLYSHHATDPAGGQLLNAFDLVRVHKFGALDVGKETQEITRLPSYKAMCEFASSDEGYRRAHFAESMDDFSDMIGEDGANGEEGAKGTSEMGAQDTLDDAANVATHEDDTDLTWTNDLTLNHKTGEVDPTYENAVLILLNDPRLKGVVAYNEFSNRIVVRRDLPWRKIQRGGDDLWTDPDASHLFWFMEKYWHMAHCENIILKALDVVMMNNRFHPVREYLDNLPEWDGVERADTLLIRYMGATDNAYVRAVTRKWLCACVARVYTPGRKFDNMLVLVGRQGIGKSRLPAILSKGWFTDSLTGLGTKESYESISGCWIVELAELAATRRAEIETVKNFISKQEDVYRPSYGRYVVNRPRQCCFFGTTNEQEVLRDRTGNRRFWMVDVAGFERGQLKGLESEVDLVWAEIKQRWKDGETLWLDDEELSAMATRAQEDHLAQDEMVGQIEQFLEQLIPDKDTWYNMDVASRQSYFNGGIEALAEGVRKRDVVCISEIRVEMCGEPLSKNGGNDSLSRHIASIMNSMQGWSRAGLANIAGYGRQRVYRRTGGHTPEPQSLADWLD